MPVRSSRARLVIMSTALLSAALALPTAAAGAATLGAQALAGSACHPTDVGTLGYSANLVDHTVSVINLAEDKVVGTIGGFHFPDNLEVTPDGSKVFVDDAPLTDPAASTVDVVDTCTDAIVKRIPTLGNAFSSMSPDGTAVYATNITTAGIQVIDTASESVVARYLTTPLAQEAVSADGATLWVVAMPNLVYSIGMRTGLLSGLPINTGLLPTQIAISPDGSTLGVVDLDGDVALINTHTRAVTATINLGALSYPSFGVFSPDNRYLWVGAYSGEVAVIDRQTDTVVKTIDAGGWVDGVTLSHDGSTAYVATTPMGSVIPALGAAYLVPILTSTFRHSGLIRVYNAHTYTPTATITTGDVPSAIAIP
jgi:YVTN family beta-propeller protein